MQEGLAVDYSRVEVENCVPFSTCPAGQVICPIRFSTCREGWAVPTSVFYQVAGTGTMEPWNRPTEGTREEGCPSRVAANNTPMTENQPDIVILDQKIDRAELARLVTLFFGDMVKYVVDVANRRIAIGGDLHADAEQILLTEGSRQLDLWGANYYPGKGREDCIEYTSLINIRPSQGNRGMEVTDPAIREQIREITLALIGEGEPLE
jgi:hypothetical protein